MSTDMIIEEKEPDKNEIQKVLKQNLITIFNQIKCGCSRKICYNIYCGKNLICQKSTSTYIIYNF